MTLLNHTSAYRPMSYPWAYEAWKTQQQIHWLADEIPMADDVKDWKTKLTDAEKNLLTQIFRFFTQADIEVNDCYMQHYSRVFKPIEIKMMLAAFSNTETIHVDAYSTLIETLGMPDTIYQQFLEYKEMKDKHDYMQNFNVDSKHDIALTLAAFGAFTEGLQLFASFAILLNFPRFNKMKGMGQIVTWSVRDESVSKDTSILTARGWATINDISNTDKVAQYDTATKQISFVQPERINKYIRKGDMVKIKNRFIDSHVTTSHDMLVASNIDRYTKIHAEDIALKRWVMPVAGLAAGADNTLTDFEKLLIILQADGCTGRDNGYWQIQVKKSHKIEHITSVLSNLGITYHLATKNSRGMIRFSFRIDRSYTEDIVKSFRWMDYINFSAEKCRNILHYAKLFDGHIRKDANSFIYCNTNKAAIDKLQIVGVLAGYGANICKTIDNRKETYKDYYRLSFTKNDYRTGTNKDITLNNEYEDWCWCITMPKGTIVTRHNDNVLITGNTLHFQNIIQLFKTFVEENRDDLDLDKLKKDIYNACLTIVAHEDKFIELAFEQGGIQGLTAHEVKKYIRYIADRRLEQLGYAPYFLITENPLVWMDEILNGVEFANFFEQRVTEYSKGAMAGEWNDSIYD